MKKTYWFILICFVLISSCRNIEKPDQATEQEVTLTSFLTTLSPFVSDQSLDFFLENQWYTYDQANHIIWPNFRVYGLRSAGKYYKFQVLNYYDEASESGNYTIRIAGEDASTRVLSFAAQGCGNTFNNPDYDNCVKDPARNTFTYVNILTGTSRQLSESQAKLDDKWHLAFLGTKIKLNSGKNGPGNVRAASLYLYGAFYPNGTASFQRLAEESFGRKGSDFFNLNFEFRNAPYALPAGIDRVIFEDDWLKKDTNFFKAKSENWWLIKSPTASTKFNVFEINESMDGDEVVTRIKLKLSSRKDSKEEFSKSSTLELPVFKSSQRLVKICIDLDKSLVIKCGSEGVDLTFSGLNRRNRRRWRFNVSSGAVGPLSLDEISNY